MNRWILEMREYNYEINYLNYVADHLSRLVRILVHPPETSWLGLDKPQYVQKQYEDAVWIELLEYLKGGKVPSKRLPKAILDQFVLTDELLYYVREKTDGSLHSLIVPHGLRTQPLQHDHELSGHLGQKKIIKKAEELFYWVNHKEDICENPHVKGLRERLGYNNSGKNNLPLINH